MVCKRMVLNYRPPLLGVVGKTNVGKSTFFAAATMASVEISNRPFTTIKPNEGVGFVRSRCPHVEFGLESCNPRTGFCANGTRFVPVKLMDVAGLIPGAHEGRGLGNRFMDDLRQSDCFLLVVDAAGSTDEEGNPLPPGSRDPVEEAKLILREIDLWIAGILLSDWRRFSMYVETSRKNVCEALHERLSGLSISRHAIATALERSGLEGKKLSSWSREDVVRFASELRKAGKPHVIVANKIDLPAAEEGIKRLKEEFKDTPVIPASAAAELALKKASRMGAIEYVPGSSDFKIVNDKLLSDKQLKALEYIKENVLRKYGSTGVQQALETAVYDVLGMIVVYPVEDPVKLCDRNGRVLPDALIVKKGTTARELAYMIHSDLGKNFVCAVDAKTKKRLGETSELYNGMVIRIVASR